MHTVLAVCSFFMSASPSSASVSSVERICLHPILSVLFAYRIDILFCNYFCYEYGDWQLLVIGDSITKQPIKAAPDL